MKRHRHKSTSSDVHKIWYMIWYMIWVSLLVCVLVVCVPVRGWCRLVFEVT